MTSDTVHIEGVPATFATRREKVWMAMLAASIPSPSMGGREAGVSLEFNLPTLAPHGQPLDVDNLCEPVFVVLVRHAGWFGGRKSGILWWAACKQAATPYGCTLSITREVAPALPVGDPAYDEVYHGVLPSSANAPEVADWAEGIRSTSECRSVSDCSVFLGFSSRAVNIGDISTGVVKSFVDCLYPLYGGRRGAPDDHRISHLVVQKAVSDIPPGSVRVALWFADQEPLQVPARSVIEAEPLSEEDREMNNPC